MPERQVITSLVGTVAPLLTVDTSIPEVLDYNSLWMPRIWKKSTPFVVDDLVIQPLGPSQLGVEMSFEIPKLATCLSDLILRIVVPPSTIAPLGAQAYYVDHLGFAIIKCFNVNFGSNQVYTREKYDLYFKYRHALGIEKTDAVNRMVQGDRTLAQRNAFLLNGGTLLIPLNLPFTTHQSMELPIVTLSQKTRFNYQSESFQNLWNPPAGVPGVTVTPQGPFDISLRIMVVHPTGDEAAFLLAMSQSSDGICYMIHQNVRQNADDFASQQNNFEMVCKLSAMTKPLKILYWGLIPTKIQNNTGRNDFFMFSPTPTPVPQGMTAYSPIESWRIEANGMIVQREIEADYNQLYQHFLYHESFCGNELFFQTYSEYPHSVNAACGYLDYTNLVSSFSL